MLPVKTVQKANASRDGGEVPLINQASDAGHTYYWAPIPVNK